MEWSFANPLYPYSGFSASVSPSSGMTGSAGSITGTFTPTNDAVHVPGSSLTATIGVGTSFPGASGSSASITTVAGAPTKVSFYFVAGTYSTDYLVAPVTLGTTLYAGSSGEISLSLSDAFTNPVPFSSSVTNITITGVGGEFLSGTNLYSTISCGAVVAGNSHFESLAACQSGSSISQPTLFQYLQPSTYGTITEISASIFIGSTTYTGTSANIITSTLGTLSQTGPTAPINVAAGQSVLVQDQLSLAQPGVPITLNLCTSAGCGTTASYNGKFSNGLGSITLYSNSTGGVEALMPVNTTAGATPAVAYFNSTAPAPTNALPKAIITGAVSLGVTTVPGIIKTLVINVAANPGPVPAQGLTSNTL